MPPPCVSRQDGVARDTNQSHPFCLLYELHSYFRMLEIRHLRTLAALADTGSVSVAAKRVHLTQSALSHQLKTLEDRYGTTLFQRKSNPLRLSPAGQRLLDLA